MFWDEDDNTIDVILNGYIMKVGEDQFYPVKNQTGSNIPKGTSVRFAGTLGSSGRLLIAPFLADGSLPSTRFMGVTAEAIANGEDGKVLWFGRLRGINTSAFAEGDILYASTTVAGGFQTTVPTAPNNIVEIAAVVTDATNGTIFIRPQFLQGTISIGSPANGLSLAGTVLSLGLASSSTTGALSGTDWDTFNGKIGGSLTSGRIAIAAGSNTLTDSDRLVWNGTNALDLGTGLTFRIRSASTATFVSSTTGLFYLRPLGDTNLTNQILLSSAGIAINTTSATAMLDVNGTTRIRTISNLGSTATRFLVASATGVVSERTGAELVSDLGISGGSNWTILGSDIYRNSKVTIGQTTIITSDLGIKQNTTDSALRIDGLARTTRRTIESIYEGSTLRYTIDNYGIPIWRLWTGSAEGGALAFTVPGSIGEIGVLVANSDSFTSANRGYLTWVPTNTTSTSKSIALGSRNTDRMLVGGTGKFAFNGPLVSNVSMAVYQVSTDIPFAVYTGSTVRFFVSTAGEIRTTAPTSGGNSNWKLGGISSATVSLDTTRYVNIEINGTAYKLALAV
jgi:hypothetical protein